MVIKIVNISSEVMPNFLFIFGAIVRSDHNIFYNYNYVINEI